ARPRYRVRRESRGAFDPLSALSESVLNQRFEGVERLISVGALRAQGNHGPMFGGEHHHAHDALAVHVEIVLADGDLALKFRRQLDDFGGWPRMQAVLVDDLDGA